MISSPAGHLYGRETAWQDSLSMRKFGLHAGDWERR
jgi:hypothetical protein